MRTNSFAAAAAAIGLIAGAPAAYATTITFDTAPQGPLFAGTSVSEGGFIYSVQPGTELLFVARGVTGNDVEGIPTHFGRGSQTGVLQITSAIPGATFTFAGLDAADVSDLSFESPQPITVTGLLDGNSVGTQDFTLAFTNPPVVPFHYTAAGAGTLAGVTVDTLDIAITAIFLFGFSGYGAIDNVVVATSSVAAVPEPASIALVGVGVVGIAGCRRRGSV